MAGARLDVPGVVLVSAGVFCLVYGFSNAATHGWSTPSTYGFLAVGVVLLAAFAFWISRASNPLLPPRVVLDRNRGAAYLAILIVGAGMFGIFLFLTYYLQDTLGYSPVVTGLAFLPMIAYVATIVQRVQHRAAAAHRAEADRVGRPGARRDGDGLADPDRPAVGIRDGHPGADHRHRPRHGPGVLDGRSTPGSYGVRPQDTGVASASVNTSQQLGGAIGTALLNTIAASATVSYLTSHSRGRPTAALAALVHGYTTAFWWCAGIFLAGAVLCGSLMRSGPLQGRPAQAAGAPAAAPAGAGATAPVSASE